MKTIKIEKTNQFINFCLLKEWTLNQIFNMKKIALFFALLFMTTMAMSQVKVATNGNVGIAFPNPTDKLHVEGSVRISAWTDILFDWTGKCCGSPVIYPETDWYLQLGKLNKKIGSIYVDEIHCANYFGLTSDERSKENITPLGNSIEKIMRISAYNYNFKEKLYPENLPSDIISELTKKQIGFLAQELEQIFPELVKKPDTEEDFYSVNYLGMIPVLLEAIKEQQTSIEQQQKKMEILQNITFSQESELIELRKTMKELQNVVSQCCITSKSLQTPTLSEETEQLQEKAVLMQNNPNPFHSNTEISCYIPETKRHAFLYVYNLQGVELKTYPITQAGLNTIIIIGSELPAGMYLYTLVVDNEIIDTKRMILTK